MPAPRVDRSVWAPLSASASVGLFPLLLLAFLVFSSNVGCPQPEVPDPNGSGPDPSSKARTCVGCHTDQALLQEVARTEEPPPADTGEG